METKDRDRVVRYIERVYKKFGVKKVNFRPLSQGIEAVTVEITEPVWGERPGFLFAGFSDELLEKSRLKKRGRI